jgi:hypothetical protein
VHDVLQKRFADLKSIFLAYCRSIGTPTPTPTPTSTPNPIAYPYPDPYPHTFTYTSIGGSDSAEDATEMEMGEFQVRGRVA